MAQANSLVTKRRPVCVRRFRDLGGLVVAIFGASAVTSISERSSEFADACFVCSDTFDAVHGGFTASPSSRMDCSMQYASSGL